jgi:O-antigen ligase
MTAEESRAARNVGTLPSARPAIPARLRLLLWIMAVNGAALGIEGIIQRLEGSGKQLFLVKPRVNPGAETQFGPYAYRSNAAQYLNLIWPVTLGFWWWLQQSAGRTIRKSRRHWLLLCAAIMAACPIISTSRAGALTGMAMLALAVAILISGKRGDGLVKLAVLGVFALALAGGLYLGWQSLNPRLDELAEGFQTRELIYKTARLIAKENPVFGTGPGTFEHVFQLYRQSLTEYWPAQLHNDWLEIRLTFGWAGFGLVLWALAAVLAHWFCAGGVGASRRFTWLVWLALGGCLLQARWDFPFQIYSIVFLFLALCAILTTVSRLNRGS